MCVCVHVYVLVYVQWQTRKWWSRSDIRPLKQPRINGLNRQAPLEGCGRVIRTSTSHSQSIHLPFRIHALLELELPDVEPPVEKGTLVSCHRGRKDSSKNSWVVTALMFLLQGTQFLSQGHLWWSELEMVSGQDSVTGGVTVYMETGEVRDIRHCRDSSQGPEENLTWKMSLGYSDILRFERVWKGSNTNSEVKAAAMNMSHLHEKMETNLRGKKVCVMCNFWSTSKKIKWGTFGKSTFS